LLSASAAQAQSGEPITNCDAQLDLVTGPVLGSGRVVGLGGAYTALAAGIEGAAKTPASYATRTPWDDDWFEWNGTIDLMPSTIRNSDFDNNGQRGVTYGDMLFTNIGLGFQFGAFGIGAVINAQSYGIREKNVDLSLVMQNYGAGYMFADGQFVVGVGLRAAQLNMTARGSGTQLVDSIGLGPEAGALLQPAGRPWRLGAAARLAARSNALSDCVAAGLFLPRNVYSPWEIQVGFAYQLGTRPLNRRWVNPHDEANGLRAAMFARRVERARAQLARERLRRRMSMSSERLPPRVPELEPDATVRRSTADQPSDATWWREERTIRSDEERELEIRIRERERERKREIRALSRRYLLFSGEVVLLGAAENGVGLEAFLAQRKQESGRNLSLGLRLGIEGEPIADWVQLRTGTYFEPSRFAGVGYRAHGTLGVDVRVLSWNLFGLLDEFTVRLGASADVAERYLNASLGIGLWH
jgi:hypothetical protein